MKLCTVPGCGRRHVAQGYCDNHYRMFKRHGTPTPAPRPRKTHVATGGYLFQTIRGETVYEHVVVAERALGKPLPAGAELHHVNGDEADNRNENLVICPNHQYHMLLHQRQRALDECGNAHWRRCRICRQYDDPRNLNLSGKVAYHAACSAQQAKINRAKEKSCPPPTK